MPEGDTVHRIARALGAELTGRTLSALALHDRSEVAELAGHTIESVEAVGKHLLVNFSGDWTLRVHLGMHGGWLRKHVLEPRLRGWTVIITAGEVAYVCRRSYRAELLRSSALATHPRLARLGPDILADPPRIDEMVKRARLSGHAEREIGDVLLDQRVASGIGNIYKSETLFEARVHPRKKVRELSDAQLTFIFETAARLMRLNLLTRRRTSVPLCRRGQPSSRRLWVYRSEGRPCLDCGTPIERFLQGDMARSTYFCPHCQAQRPDS
jgi:endonuclease VIII